MRVVEIDSYNGWRSHARRAIETSVHPDAIRFAWRTTQRMLFQEASGVEQPARSDGTVRCSRKFVEASKVAVFHSDDDSCNVLYRLLWRLNLGEPRVMDDPLDGEVQRVARMAKAVTRDAHKAKAFVRFRPVGQSSDQRWVAWHRSDHRILRLVAPFFALRFPSCKWAIGTPLESVAWDGEQLRFGHAAPRPAQDAYDPDELVELWRSYYASTFNPARANVRTMTREMPTRYWSTMPETELVPDLVAAASKRTSEMVGRETGATIELQRQVQSATTLQELRKLAAGCRACDLCELGSRVVFGEGPQNARLVFLGEQPGDNEDRVGRPFVGPAGDVLNEVLAEAGIDRSKVYLTNTVKHFRFVERGKARLHKKPAVRHVNACSPWLRAEVEFVGPELVVCLGLTAAQAAIDRTLKVRDARGQLHRTHQGVDAIVTNHPSAILRARDSAHSEQLRREMVEDLRFAAARQTNAIRGTADTSQERLE